MPKYNESFKGFENAFANWGERRGYKMRKVKFSKKYDWIIIDKLGDRIVEFQATSYPLGKRNLGTEVINKIYQALERRQVDMKDFSASLGVYVNHGNHGRAGLVLSQAGGHAL